MQSSELTKLYRLQEIENDLISLERERKNAPEVKVLAELRERQDKFKKLIALVTKRLKNAQKKVRAAELDLGTAQEGRQTVRDRLYGGQVTGSKELAQLEERHEELLKEIDNLESAVLEAMETAEDLQGQLDKVNAGAARNKTQLEVAEQRLAHKESEWDLKVDMLQIEQEDMRESIDPALLALYDRKKSSTRNTPVALVQRGVCGGCRMELPSAIRQNYGKQLVTCEQCGRVLHWPE